MTAPRAKAGSVNTPAGPQRVKVQDMSLACDSRYEDAAWPSDGTPGSWLRGPAFSSETVKNTDTIDGADPYIHRRSSPWAPKGSGATWTPHCVDRVPWPPPGEGEHDKGKTRGTHQESERSKSASIALGPGGDVVQGWLLRLSIGLNVLILLAVMGRLVQRYASKTTAGSISLSARTGGTFCSNCQSPQSRP